ncbi:MAG TPA: acylphosphatase [Solirubrobacteraceae bacterium]
MSGVVARHLVIHGRVQGVWFRASVRDAARARGVSGWAANRADGTVEAHLEGPADAVAEVERFCGQGPPRAQVTSVDARDAEPSGAAGFETR